MVDIFCKNCGSTKSFVEGTSLKSIATEFGFNEPYKIVSARVNNVSEGLTYKVFNSKSVEFLDYSSYDGRNVYCRSICFLLCKATQELFPNCKIVIRRPISKGFYCTIERDDSTAVSHDEVDAIRLRMREIVAQDLPFIRHHVLTEEAVKLFKSLGYTDKVKLLESCGDLYITYYTLGDCADYYYNALVPSSAYLKVWDIMPYRGGILIRVPNRHKPDELAPFIDQNKTFEILDESLRWNKIMGLNNVGDVNIACQKGMAPDLIQVAEALQEKKIVQIAEEIERRYNSPEKVKIVLITGPTSSGKSTFCKRLSVQLKACGLRPISFSTDDYFVNRVDTPKLPDGSYDFDNFETVDHKYLQNDLLKLMNGEEVEVPEYNFVTGLREFNGKRLKITDGSILLIEGIHALNPRLTDKVSENEKFRIFINTITSVSLDNHNSIPTSDNRLLRRIIRDYNKGAFTARETISAWPNVRRSEVQWIYPFQEDADVLFNSTYLIEFAVLRTSAEKILATVPKNCPEYSEAYRLKQFLHYFTPVSEKEIPTTSIMKSFV